MSRICLACQEPNRDSAKFCRRCGKPLPVPAARTGVAPGVPVQATGTPLDASHAHRSGQALAELGFKRTEQRLLFTARSDFGRCSCVFGANPATSGCLAVGTDGTILASPQGITAGSAGG